VTIGSLPAKAAAMRHSLRGESTPLAATRGKSANLGKYALEFQARAAGSRLLPRRSVRLLWRLASSDAGACDRCAALAGSRGSGNRGWPRD
jgi:hypothetical protein